MVKGLIARDQASFASDYDGDLAFIVQSIGCARYQNGLAVCDMTVHTAGEQPGIGGVVTRRAVVTLGRLPEMAFGVQANADHESRSGNGRQPMYAADIHAIALSEQFGSTRRLPSKKRFYAARLA